MRRSPIGFAFALACVFGIAPAAAAAEPILSPPPPANLRLSLACADAALLTPESGLDVAVDGTSLPPGNTRVSVSTEISDGTSYQAITPYEVDYAAPAGVHELRLAAPGCVEMRRTVLLHPLQPLVLDGSLEAAPELRGPVDAPDGGTVSLDAFALSFPRSLSSGPLSADASHGARFSLDTPTLKGGSLSWGVDKKHFALRIDWGFGGGDFTGRITRPGETTPGATTATSLEGTYLVMPFGARVGARLPLHYVALAAGSGVGGAFWMAASANTKGLAGDASGLERPHPVWNVPLWASLTVKAACDWGAEIGASYAIAPTETDANTLLLSLGVVWQPSGACSRAPYLRAVRTS